MPKIYQLGISKIYLKKHPKAGQPTHFRDKIVAIVLLDGKPSAFKPKIHTIRPNYDYWKGIEEKVNSGEGVLSLRQWEGTPYKSKRPAFMHLSKMGVEKFRTDVVTNYLPGAKMYTAQVWINDILCHSLKELALNDGLKDEEDLILWLGARSTFHGCIIHFTEHRYGHK